MKEVSRRVSLFLKFVTGITITVFLFGFLNVLIVRNSVIHSLEKELEYRGIFIAKTLAERAIGFVLAGNIVELNRLLNETSEIDPSIHYVFVTNDRNEVVASTLNQSVPVDLIQANPAPGKDEVNITLIQIKDDKNLLIKDFSVPILDKSIGVIRVGIQETKIQKEVNTTIKQLLLMIAIFFVLGIIGAFFFSYIIATPIRYLSQKADIVDLNTIQDIKRQIIDSRNNIHFRMRNMYGIRDEIDVLYDKFQQMLDRLDATRNKLDQAQQSLSKSEKMAAVGTLTAGIAHEINNPLAGIMNCLQRIAKRPDDPEQTLKYVELMEDALSRIEIVVQDLLRFSRKEDLDVIQGDLSGILKRSIKLAQFKIKNKNIRIIDDFSGYDTIPVMPGRLEQVFVNMLFNAIDSINEEAAADSDYEGVIGISVVEEAENLSVEITDNGRGISPVEEDKIFDPFYTTKEPGKGTGLGLSVSYQIVTDHGGTIKVRSESGGNTTFVVSLPKTRKK